jgi:tetratricopeptide (TPR) repeat protein
MTGCSQQPRQDSSASTEQPVPVAAPEKDYSRPFPPETLYDLLVAEIAAQRKEYNVALNNYLKQAAATRDPGITARATRIARFLRVNSATLEAAQLWVALEPDNFEARHVAATELTRARKPFESFTHMQVLHEAGQPTNFSAIAASALQLPSADQQIMLSNIENLLEKANYNSDLLVAKTVLQQSVDGNEAALRTAQELLKIEPLHTQGLFIEAQLLSHTGDATPYARIEKILEAHPDNQPIREQYARILLKENTQAAIEQYRVLKQQNPDNLEFNLPLAALYIEKERNDQAKPLLTELLQIHRFQSIAHYYLGEIERNDNDIEKAVHHYEQVQPGKQFMSAIQQGAELVQQTWIWP